MATGDLIEFGTLLMNGVKQIFPTKPWRTDTTPPGASSVGDIPSYTAGATVSFANSDANSAYKIKCREVNVDGKKLLIPTANLLVNISHDDLKTLGFVDGKEYVIDGKRVLARLMTGGSNYRSGTDNYSGASPSNNEWDRIISNEAAIAGLPTPTSTDLDTSQNTTDFNGVHNKYWNWFYIWSWVKETYSGNAAYRVVRGNASARYFYWAPATYRYLYCGFRPVFEVLDSAPVISGTDENLGNKAAPFAVTYSVTEPEGQTFNIVEKINGTQIGATTATSTLLNRKIQLTLEQWNSLALNTAHKLRIEATDSAGNTSTREYTFTKTNSAPVATIVEPKGDLTKLAIVDSLTPVLVHKFTDIDTADAQSAYQYVIEDTNGIVAHDTGKVVSTQSFLQAPVSVLKWGTRYKFKVRVWDKYDVPSEYTAYEFFLPNRAPNVTNIQPGSNDPLLPKGTGVTPNFTWTFEDLDLEAQAAYQLKIYNESDVLVLDTFKVHKNVSNHQISAGELVEGTTYYAVLTVWDPNGLSKTSEKAYFRTNATPSTPFLTSPVDKYRTPLKPTFKGVIGTDSEDNGQHFIIQVSKDSTFKTDVLTFRSDTERIGWKVNEFDIPPEGVFNAQQGQTVSYTMQIELERNKTYYWRLAAIDASTGAIGVFSTSRSIRVGNVLQFTLSNPIKTNSVAARRILLAADYKLPSDGATKASIKVEVCNNALDINPTWENATEKFLAMDYYNFTNSIKTALEFAISVRITINSNDSIEPIYVDAIGLTFD